MTKKLIVLGGPVYILLAALVTFKWFLPLDTQSRLAWSSWLYTLATILLVLIAVVGGYLAFRGYRTASAQLTLSQEDSYNRLLFDLLEKWEDDPMLKARKTCDDAICGRLRPAGNFATTASPADKAANLKETLEAAEQKGGETTFLLVRIPNYFDTVGYLVGERVRTIGLQVLGPALVYYYEMYKPWIESQRARFEPALFIRFEELYKAAKALQQKRPNL